MGVFADTIRAVAKAAPPFPGWGSGSWGSWGGTWGGRLPIFRGMPGERDWSKLIGDGSGSSIVEACVLWLCRNFPEAPPIVVDSGADGIPQIVRGHALPKKLRRPNPYYSGTLLMYGLITSFIIDGNGYILKIRDQLGRIAELWWVPHFMLEPRWSPDGSDYISYYDYRPMGQFIQIAPRDVYHLRYGLDPENSRKGRSPLRTLFRELGVDEEASRFSASILHNLGVPGVVIAPDKESKGALDENARDAIKAKFKESFGGDKRGDPIVMSKPTNIVQFGFSPGEMDLGAIRDIPEERVTAVLGIPAAVVGFGTGLQTAKVGATMSELRDQAYENCIIPTQRLVADELSVQMLPDFATEAELERLEVAFDLSKVRVLQEAQGKLAERQSTLARAGIAKRSEARAAVGLPVRPEDDVFIPSPGVQIVQPDGSVADATAAQQTALAQATQQAAKEREAERAAAGALEERRSDERRREAQADRLAVLEGLREVAKAGAASGERTERVLGELKQLVVSRAAPLRTVEKEVTARDGNGHIKTVVERELVEER